MKLYSLQASTPEDLSASFIEHLHLVEGARFEPRPRSDVEAPLHQTSDTYDDILEQMIFEEVCDEDLNIPEPACRLDIFLRV